MTHPTTLEQDLDELRTLFLQMCVRSESMVRLAVRSVVERDPHLGRVVVEMDAEVDGLELAIDRRCVRCLAVSKPDGSDLRTVTTTMKMVTDLERIGDLAVNIAERGLELTAGWGLQPGDDLLEMGTLAADMVRVATDAFVAADVPVARTVRETDREVDRLNKGVFQRCLSAMAEHPDQASRALAYTSISKYLERIADHAVNLSEMVIYLVEGTDFRHADYDA